MPRVASFADIIKIAKLSCLLKQLKKSYKN